jgi:hypothetical protein
MSVIVAVTSTSVVKSKSDIVASPFNVGDLGSVKGVVELKLATRRWEQ